MNPCPEYPPADPAIEYSFPLDPFQQWAVVALHRGENVLVTAKTGSGKTLVAEYATARALKQGKRVFYTTPIKSLSNQKYHDLKHLFPQATVGILTGDIKSNPDAQIVIMTTEILRNLLFKTATATASLGVAGAVSLDGVGVIVFDEVHYINDPDRGHVWEESLILVPPTIQLVLLSATIDQPAAFADWLSAIKQVPCALLNTTYRIVPLVHALYTEGLKDADQASAILKDRDEAPANVAAYKAWLQQQEARKDAVDDWKRTVAQIRKAGESAAGRADKAKTVSFQHRLNECVRTLARKELLPALFFVFSRRDCERYAEKVSETLLTGCEQADVRGILAFHLHRYRESLERLPQYHQLVALLERGIAFHHSGVLPLLREAIELLFQRGLIRVLFCTESLAIGVNLPARTVVFTSLEKPCDGGGFRTLRYDEYAQMAGRAGRRGKDVRGYVFYMPAKEPLGVEAIRGVLSGSLPVLQSRLQFGYDFVLKALHLSATANAVATATAAETQPLWERLLKKSYWTVQREAALKQREAQLADARSLLDTQAARLTDEQRRAFAEREDLEWKSRHTTNSKQKAAKLALRRWTEDHDSPAWKVAERAYAAEKETQKQVRAAAREEQDARSALKSEDRVVPILRALHEWGFVEDDLGRLTHRGILATEVNEGNPVLMTELYLSRALADASDKEIVGILASFVIDSIPSEYSAATDAPCIHRRAEEILAETAERCRRYEHKHQIETPTEWSTSPFWSTILMEWMSGSPAAAIIKESGVYEGNFMRTILKVMNLVDEWTAMATYCGDVGMLDKLKDVPATLLRDIVQPESIYLRL